MTNTICILNELIDEMCPDNYLFVVVSDQNAIQFIRAIGTRTTQLKDFFDERSIVVWDELGVSEEKLRIDQEAVFAHGQQQWQLHLVSIEHLNEGHFGLAMIAPASCPAS